MGTDFFGGMAQGLDPGIQQWAQDVRNRRIAAAQVNAAMAGDDQQPPMAQPNPMAALANVGRPQPAPPSPQLGQRPPQMASAPPMRSGPPMGPAPRPQPQVQPQPDPNLSATAQPGQDFGDPVKEAQQTLGAMIRSIKRSNPKIDPLTLMGAVHSQLDDMKGIMPTTKAVMQGQVQLLKTQVDMQYKYAKLNSENENFANKMAELARRHADQHEFDMLRADHMKALEDIMREGLNVREDIAEKHDEAQTNIAAGRNQTQRDIATGRNETQKDIAGLRSRDSRYRADQGYRGAQVRGGVKPDAAPDAARAGLPPDAQQAPDGHWYAKRNGRYVRFD